MDSEKRNFDQDAASWDLNPGRVKLAANIARSIMENVALTGDMDVLDFGCGTGLLTLALRPFVGSVTGVDSSQGMLDVLRRKISDQGLANVMARHLDWDRGDVLPGSYHLIVSSMTLHHVKDIPSLLEKFHFLLRPSGVLAAADLDSEGGLFHADNSGVFHFGFDREALRRQFENAGFRDIRVTQASEIEKPAAGGATRTFTVFLMTGHQ